VAAAEETTTAPVAVAEVIPTEKTTGIRKGKKAARFEWLFFQYNPDVYLFFLILIPKTKKLNFNFKKTKPLLQ
jgi:hypothetical protein